MKTPEFPTPEQIKKVLGGIEKILSKKALKRREYFFAKEGYQECLRMLDERLRNPKNDYFKPDTEEEIGLMSEVYRKQVEPIRKLKTEKGRGIALLCNDFLNGEEERFLNILPENIDFK
jgi:hypothetical protein